MMAPTPNWSSQRWVIMLALLGSCVDVFASLPALPHIDLASAPGWACIVLLAAGLHLAYVVWMTTVPDSATIWVGMTASAIVAAMYTVGVAVGLSSQEARPAMLELTADRVAVALWCAGVAALYWALAFGCGRLCYHWLADEASTFAQHDDSEEVGSAAHAAGDSAFASADDALNR